MERIDAEQYTNAPSGVSVWSLFRVYSIGSSLVQELTMLAPPNNYGRTFQRIWTGTVWDNWHELAYDIPTFYKNYASLASLITGLSGLNTDGEFLSHIKRLHNVGTSGTDKTVLAPVYNSTMACYIVTITSRVYYVVVENNAIVTTSKLNDAVDPASLDGFIVDSGNLCAKWKSSVTFYEIKCWY